MSRASARGQGSPVITRRALAPRQNSCPTTDSTNAVKQNMISEAVLSAASVNSEQRKRARRR